MGNTDRRLDRLAVISRRGDRARPDLARFTDDEIDQLRALAVRWPRHGAGSQWTPDERATMARIDAAHAVRGNDETAEDRC